MLIGYLKKMVVIVGLSVCVYVCECVCGREAVVVS